MMKLLTLALSAMLFALAAAPSANAWVRPEWVVVRWANADWRRHHHKSRKLTSHNDGVARDNISD
jgi:hypothetical protein